LLFVGFVIFERRHVVFLSELLSHLLNLVFENFFVLFMFSAESDTLVGVLLGQLVRDQLESVLLLGSFLDALSFRIQLIALASCRSQFFSQRVDIATVLLVFGLGLVETDALIIYSGFLAANCNILFHLLEACRFLFII